jgi:hypothetical protein
MTKPACAECDNRAAVIRQTSELAVNYCLSCEPPFGGACKCCEISKIQLLCRTQTNKVLASDMPEPPAEAQAEIFRRLNT